MGTEMVSRTSRSLGSCFVGYGRGERSPWEKRPSELSSGVGPWPH